MKFLKRQEFRILNKEAIANNEKVNNLHFLCSNWIFELLADEKIIEDFKLLREFAIAYNEFKNDENFKENGIFVVFENEEKELFVAERERAKFLKELFNALKSANAPDGVFEELKKWEIVNKSPYSCSFYNAKEIDWDEKPEGSLRISDHWNFLGSNGSVHGRLNTTADYVENTWILAQYKNGIYNEIKRF